MAELLVLFVLFVIMFGPEKLPEMSRKAARLIYTVRTMAHHATSQLKAELGPGYQDLTLADLNPKTFVRKQILSQIDELDDIKQEIHSLKSDLGLAAHEVNQAAGLADKRKTQPAPVHTRVVEANTLDSVQEPLAPVTQTTVVVTQIVFDDEAT